MELRDFVGTDGAIGHHGDFRVLMVADGAFGCHGHLWSFWDIMVAHGAAGILLTEIEVPGFHDHR